MSKPKDATSFDQELALARMLVDAESSDVNIDRESAQQFSHKQLDDFKRAKECLELLRFAMPHHPPSETVDIQKNVATEYELDIETPCRQAVGSNLPEIPNRIGRFSIVREIGKGGFGIVLLAHDPTLDREVALKIPRAQTLISDEARKRFQREARAAALLSHPAIVPIFECGQLGPVDYIAYAYCEGTSLDSWMEAQGPVDARLAAMIVARLAAAIGHAHQRGIIHRDIKPGNILIADHGVPEHESAIVDSLRVTDFGLAAWSIDEDRLTADGALVGTPAYMAPEQIDGSGAQGADIYSLGVVLFELLTGSVPFSGATNLAIVKAVVDSPAPSPRSWHKRIPHDLAAICLKCLEKNPTSRYASANDLNDDLNRFLDHRPVKARRRSIARRCGMWLGRNPFAGILIFLLATSLVVGSVSTWQQYAVSQTNLSFAQSNFREAKSTVDQLLAKALSVELEAHPKLRTEMLQVVAQFYQQFIEQQQDDPSLHYDLAIAQRNLAKIDRTFGRHERALQGHQQAHELLASAIEGDADWPPRLEELGNLIDIGLQLDFLGRLDEAVSIYDSAILKGRVLRERFPDLAEIDLEFSRALKNLGSVYRQLDDLDQAKPLFDQSLNIRMSLVQSHPDELSYRYREALAHSSLADWHIESGQFDDALWHAQKQQQIVEDLIAIAPNNLAYQIRLPTAINRVSDVYRNFKRGAEWDVHCRRLLVRAEQLQRELVEEFPLLASVRTGLVNSLANRADVARQVKRWDEAIMIYAKGLEVLRSGFDLADVSNYKSRKVHATLQRRMGMCYRAQGKRLEAFHCFDTALQECENLLSIEDNYYVNREANELLKLRGLEFFEAAELGEAEADLRQFVDRGNQRGEILGYLARIYLFAPEPLFDQKRARTSALQFLKLKPNSPPAHLLMACVCLKEHRFDAAAEFASKAIELHLDDEVARFVRAAAVAQIENLTQEEFLASLDRLQLTGNLDSTVLNSRERAQLKRWIDEHFRS